MNTILQEAQGTKKNYRKEFVTYKQKPITEDTKRKRLNAETKTKMNVFVLV